MAIAAGAKIDATDFGIKPWTPTLNMITPGSGYSLTGWYTNVSGVVNGAFYLVFGSSPAFTGTIFVDLPVTANVPGLQHAFGSWVFRVSGAVHYSGTVSGWDSGGSQMSFAGAWSGSAPNHRVGQTTSASPAAPTSGGVLSAQFTYRAA
jgi:hypothetical protein